MVFLLDDDVIGFPDPRLGEDNGMFAVGGDLSVDRLLLAYSYGIFPWFDYKRSPITWWCPMDRFVIFPDEIHISHSMRQLIKSGRYTVTHNKAFDRVISSCSKVDGRNREAGAWLGRAMIKAYTELYQQGLAASIEVWDGDKLVGGLYGVTIGKNFFGESMFSFVPSASKLALISLAKMMKGSGGLIDCQFETAHLLTMGGRHISYDEYMKYLEEDESDDD